MTVSAAVTVLVYFATLLLLYPLYFTSAIPLGLALYGATDVGWPQLLSDSRAVLLGDVVAMMLWWTYRRRISGSALPLTLAVFATGSVLVWLLEDKSWFYHRLPAAIFTTLALLYWLCVLPRPVIGWRRASLGASVPAILAMFGLCGIGLGAS
jgi:hypothetical protein